MTRVLGSHPSEPDEAYQQASRIGNEVGFRRTSMPNAEQQLLAVKAYFGRKVSSPQGFSVRLSHTMHDAANASSWEYDRQISSARKILSPLLKDGLDRASAIETVKHKHPFLLMEHVEEVVDEEAAWWLRWQPDPETEA